MLLLECIRHSAQSPGKQTKHSPGFTSSITHYWQETGTDREREERRGEKREEERRGDEERRGERREERRGE